MTSHLLSMADLENFKEQAALIQDPEAIAKNIELITFFLEKKLVFHSLTTNFFSDTLELTNLVYADQVFVKVAKYPIIAVIIGSLLLFIASRLIYEE